MTYLYLAAKFWRECIIAVLAFLLLICLFIQNHQAAEIKDQKRLHANYITQQQLAAEKSKVQAAQQEKVWAEQITKAEQNYNAKIKQIESDASDAQSSANSLSKQLASAKQRLSAASRETSDEYCATLGNVFERSIEEYTKMARYADEHRANEERLSDAWP
ncbi:hypothetical protein KTH71_04135 [Acinetobacter sp. WU_MDCI_Axc73]|uniref:hypothetical protein n=1 Tax=Acinetobacter ursingii TaxID=108980 RepID=UPI00124C61FA|nr:hypothetical protein [Acinetobacter ursingii]MCU4413236.1 hypothetical protein [Acinetobacter sp. WU_MDCI_Axc73]